MTDHNAKPVVEAILDLLSPQTEGEARALLAGHVPYGEFFSREGSFNGGLYRGYCANHPEMKYLTKGPGRSLHFVPDDPFIKECSCPLSLLMIDPVQP